MLLNRVLPQVVHPASGFERIHFRGGSCPMVRASFLALVLAAAFSLPAQSHHAGDLVLEPYSFRTFDGSAHPAELGHLWVRENRGSPSDRLIEIAFVRLRSSAPKPRSPVVFLPGGPGIPGIVMGRVPAYYELFEKLQALSDVILLDQRGIGMSSQNTQMPRRTAPTA
jgi:hypothetical protein